MQVQPFLQALGPSSSYRYVRNCALKPNMNIFTYYFHTYKKKNEKEYVWGSDEWQGAQEIDALLLY